MQKNKLTKILYKINKEIDLAEMSVFACFYFLQSDKCDISDQVSEMIRFYRQYKNMFIETKMLVMYAIIEQMFGTYISETKKIKVIAKFIYKKIKDKTKISYNQLFNEIKNYFKKIKT
ncbi:MAG: hypothetical protein NZZ41_06975 [Candidatus Dojkabacteria bacterium]|nr:hypothetical protein [Candidatus Dojkabacteria bacterium]